MTVSTGSQNKLWKKRCEIMAVLRGSQNKIWGECINAQMYTIFFQFCYSCDFFYWYWHLKRNAWVQWGYMMNAYTSFFNECMNECIKLYFVCVCVYIYIYIYIKWVTNSMCPKKSCTPLPAHGLFIHRE